MGQFHFHPDEYVVLADVIEPEDPADAVTPLTPGFDRPSRVDDQLAWLEAAGLSAAVTWRRRDLAVRAAGRQSNARSTPTTD